jgi:hypothetical protein
MDIQMTLTKKGGVPIPSYFGLKANLWHKLNDVLMQSRELNVVMCNGPTNALVCNKTLI